MFELIDAEELSAEKDPASMKDPSGAVSDKEES